MSRLPSDHTRQAQQLSAAMQARTKAENHMAVVANTSGAALRNAAAEKQASAALLLKQHDQRCNANPTSRFSPQTVALWEGHWALLMLARDLRRMADEADAREGAAPLATPPVDTRTHRVITGA